MDKFKELTTFVDVAQRGSLSAAAREEGITPAMVGRRIDQLEERLGVKLFKRSTRKVTLTPEGSTFYEDCHRVLEDLRSAEDALTVGAKSAAGSSSPRDRLRPQAHRAPPARLPRGAPQSRRALHCPSASWTSRTSASTSPSASPDLKSADLVPSSSPATTGVVSASPSYLKRAGRRRPSRPRPPHTASSPARGRRDRRGSFSVRRAASPSRSR